MENYLLIALFVALFSGVFLWTLVLVSTDERRQYPPRRNSRLGRRPHTFVRRGEHRVALAPVRPRSP